MTSNQAPGNEPARGSRSAEGQAGELKEEVLGLARGGSLNLVGQAFTQLVLLAISAILAHLLGRSGVGIYFQAYAFLSLLGLLSLSGFRAGMTRFVAAHRAEGDAGAMRGTVRFGMALTMAISVVLGIALYAAASWLARHAFHEPLLIGPLRLVAATLPFVTFTDAALSATQGFKTMGPYTLVGRIFEPGARIVLTVALLAVGHGLGGAMVAQLVSNVAASVLAAWSLRRLMGPPSAAPVYRPRELFSFSMVSWMASLASQGLIWAGTIILGIYLTSADVGTYNVATRLVVMATFVMAPINVSFGPRIADLYQRGRMDTLRRTYGVATSWILRLSLPAFVLLILFPGQLLELFGAGFAGAAAVTVILAVGKLIDAGTGPCAQMLTMSGRPLLNMIDNVGVLIANVVLNVFLIPRFGILGAAVAWAVALGAVNLARVVQVQITLGMLPFDRGVAKGAAAAVAAFAAGGVVRLVGTGIASVIAGALAIGVAYLGALLFLGITEEDRVALRSLLRRVGRGRGSLGAEDESVGGEEAEGTGEAVAEEVTEPTEPPATRGR
ncbi:MAG: flippase [Gaiellales bacterium]